MFKFRSPKDLQLERTQRQLGEWVDATIGQFGATDAGKKDFRLNNGDYVKQFVEEIIPLHLYADAYYAGNEGFLSPS